MKSIKFAFIGAICLTSILSGCDTFKTAEPETPATLTIASGENVNPVLGPEEGSVTIRFTSNGNWTAEYADATTSSWCSVNPASGSGDGSITISVLENKTNEERGALIRLCCGSSKKAIKVTQKQNDALTVTASNFEIGAEGGIISVTVKANIEYEANIAEDCSSWISATKTKVMQERTLKFKVAANEDVESRSGSIIISSGNLSETVKIEQAGVAPALIVSKKDFVVPSMGGMVDVELSSNVGITASIQDGADWISNASTKAMASSIFSFRVSANAVKEERSATILFTNSSKGLSETVTVTQRAYREQELDEVWYTTSDNAKLPIKDNAGMFDTEIVSNTYEDGVGILKLSGAPTVMKCYAINNCTSLIDALRLTSFQIPSSIRTLEAGAFNNARSIKEIIIPDGVQHIGEGAFNQCFSLEYLTLPASVEDIGYAPCHSAPVKRFLGDCKFIISDGMALTHYYNYVNKITGIDHSGLWLVALSSEAVDYVVPDGISALDNMSCLEATKLRSIYIPKSTELVGVNVFNSPELEEISGPNASADHRCFISYGELQAFAPAGLKEYTTPESATSIGGEVFKGNTTLETLTINDVVETIGMYTFSECTALKTITLSSSLMSMGYDPFKDSEGIENIYVRSLVPPILSNYTYTTEFPNLTIHVPEESLQLYENSDSWAVYKKYIKPRHYEDISNPTFYVSKDFSDDGKVTKLQSATKGNGIDIVIMGDAFSDRQISDGTYDSWMQLAMESFFSVEPYKSFRECFNVYSVAVISNTEGFTHSAGVLGTYFGEGTFVNGSTDVIKKYAFKAVDQSKEDNLTIIVIPNKDTYSGTCTMFKPAATGGYAQGLSIGWVPASANTETFSSTLNHEVGGHGFGKLSDEYYYAGTTATEYDINGYSGDRISCGWYSNIDFTTSTDDVCWAKFLKDSRYDGEHLGIFEGASFEKGAYRSRETSIMRYNTGGYNAPSREIIYKRIMSLAYGSSWTYDYEEFVKYDQINLNASTKATRKAAPVKNFVPLAPPVVVERD